MVTSLDALWRHYAKWKEQDTEVFMYEATTMKYLELAMEIQIKSEVGRGLEDGKWSMAP